MLTLVQLRRHVHYATQVAVLWCAVVTALPNTMSPALGKQDTSLVSKFSRCVTDP